MLVVHDCSGFVVTADAPGSMKDGVGSIWIVAHFDPGLDEMAAQRAFGDLQLEAVERHAVVVAGLAVFLDAENLGQIDAGNCHEGATGLACRNREAGVVGGHIDVFEEPVGGFQAGDAGQRQLLDQPVLQCLEQPLRTPARLRRIGRDMLDASSGLTRGSARARPT